MHESLVPPESVEGLSEEEVALFKSEWDVTSTLRALGHEVLPLGLASDLGVLRRAIHDFRPHIAFNLLEEFHGVAVYDQHVVSYLELMKRHYTGCNPRGLMLAHDKALAKQVLLYHRIPVPDFHPFPLNRRLSVPARLGYPALVKSATAEASKGIARSSIVHDEEQLRARVRFVHEKLATDAIAERYIEGRELYVSAIGNERVAILPTWEMTFTKREDVPVIATEKVKWDLEYQEKLGVRWARAEGLTPELEERIQRVCRRTYRALHLTGYARIDLRLTAEGAFFVLEANPNPDLSLGAEFADSAAAAGVDYGSLLERIIRLGLGYRAQWQDA
jgi:D-alanine-D-alanine ligase